MGSQPEERWQRRRASAWSLHTAIVCSPITGSIAAMAELRWAMGPTSWLVGTPVLGSAPSLSAAGVAVQAAVCVSAVAVAGVTGFAAADPVAYRYRDEQVREVKERASRSAQEDLT